MNLSLVECHGGPPRIGVGDRGATVARGVAATLQSGVDRARSASPVQPAASAAAEPGQDLLRPLRVARPGARPAPRRGRRRRRAARRTPRGPGWHAAAHRPARAPPGRRWPRPGDPGSGAGTSRRPARRRRPRPDGARRRLGRAPRPRAACRRTGPPRSSTTRCAGAPRRGPRLGVPPAGRRPCVLPAGAPSRGARRRTARRTCSRCGGRSPGLPRCGPAPPRRRRPPAARRSSRTPPTAASRGSRAGAGAARAPPRPAPARRQPQVGRRRLDRVQPVGAGDGVVGRRARREGAPRQQAGVGEVEGRGAQHGEAGEDVGLDPPVAQRLGQLQAPAQQRFAVGRRMAQGHRDVAGQLPQHHHLQPPVPGAAGRPLRRGVVLERRAVARLGLVGPPADHERPAEQLVVVELAGDRGGPPGQGDGVAGREPRQRPLRGLEPAPRRALPVADRLRVPRHRLRIGREEIGGAGVQRQTASARGWWRSGSRGPRRARTRTAGRRPRATARSAPARRPAAPWSPGYRRASRRRPGRTRSRAPRRRAATARCPRRCARPARRRRSAATAGGPRRREPGRAAPRRRTAAARRCAA